MTETFPEDDLTHAQWRDVRGILHTWEAARQAQASARIESAAGVSRTAKFWDGGDGHGGFVEMRVDSYSYHYWGQRLGYACWDDPQFCREYLRDNEYARVQSKPKDPTVSFANVGGIISAAMQGARKFFKRYGAAEPSINQTNQLN